MTHIRTISFTETLSQESSSILSMLHSHILSNFHNDTEQTSEVESELSIRYSVVHYQDLVDLQLTPQLTPIIRSPASNEIQPYKSRYAAEDSLLCKPCGRCEIF